MGYTIEPDGLPGRLHLTDLPNGDRISTVDLEGRDNDPETFGVGAMIDGLLGRHARYETVILPADGRTTVSAATDNLDEVEAQHRRAVENLMDGIVLPELDPPLIQAWKENDK